MNIIIKNVVLEVTRRCNLECRHCMREDSQNIDIDYKYIDYVLRNNHLIRVLFFSGGEPLLNSKAIIYAINKIIDENLEVLAIGFNTNGTIYDEELIDALLRYTQYALKNFSEFYQEKFHNAPVGITFSDDQYHQNNEDVIKKYLKTKDKIQYTKTGKLDFSSHFPSCACGTLPNANESKVIDGYAEPTEEYPFFPARAWQD